MKGLIFSVKRYSIHDGPGIRVTFFMKGCPLSCWWCHNPEGISPDPGIISEIHKIGDKEFRKTGETGKYYPVGEVLRILEKDRIFINESKGGVTFSGGEPLLQPEFLSETLQECRSEGYHTAVDTSGYSSPESFLTIIPHTRLFLFDLKHLDDLKHVECTGVSNTRILDNFRLILESGTDMHVRIPVIPGYNDDEDHLEKLRKFLTDNRSENLKKINLLPFHRVGQSKYERLGIQYKMSTIKPPSKERMNYLKEYFSETGIKVKIGG